MKIGPRPGVQAPPRRPNCYFFPTKIIISLGAPPGSMAKNTFFIRASVTGNQSSGAYDQTEIDLGSYTNLGSSKPEVLRIHNLTFLLQDASGQFPSMGTDSGSYASWQLTTQSQSALIDMTDDSYVAGGVGGYRNPDGQDAIPPTQATEALVLPQDFTAGYVVAVPSLFLGAQQGTNWTENIVFQVMLECSTEPMSKANAVSLAISQQ